MEQVRGMSQEKDPLVGSREGEERQTIPGRVTNPLSHRPQAEGGSKRQS